MNEKYQKLIKQWEEETQFHSSLTIIFGNENFKKIVAYGKDIVPDIFHYMETNGHSFLCEALRQILGQQFEVPADKKGRLCFICKEWMRWGKDHNYI